MRPGRFCMYCCHWDAKIRTTGRTVTTTWTRSPPSADTISRIRVGEESE